MNYAERVSENIIEVLETEKKCVQRNIDGCDRNCATCELVLPDSEIINAYDVAISILREKVESPKEITP